MVDGEFKPDEISEWFWSIIERARDRDQLKKQLQQMTEEEVVRFHDEFEEAAAQLMDTPFSEHMGEDVSEDTMKDVAECVVSQGRDFYSDVWDHPETIPDYRECKSMTTFSGVAGKVFSERFGRSMHG